MTAKSKIRLLLVDDHLIVRLGLSFLVNSQADMIVTGEAANGEEAVEALKKNRPDVVLLDLKLPDMTGVECTTRLRTLYPDLPVIILTTYGGDENIFRALQAGASAYLLKDMGSKEILGAIRAVAEGKTFIPPQIAATLAQRVGQSILTPREVAILHSISSGASNKEIGVELGISESTVKGHVNHFLSKLKARDRTEAVTIAMRRGLITLE